jgi:hypothetical protein
MKTLFKIILFAPKTVIKGSYRCLSYGNDEQLFFLVVAWALFIINAKCSKKAGAEDIIVLVSFINVMHHFSKLTVENLYLKGDLAKAIMSMLYRQNKANRKTTEAVEKEIKKLGSQRPPRGGKTTTIYVGQPQQPQPQELPKKEPEKFEHIGNDEPTEVIELGMDDYKKFEIEDYEGGLLQ